VIDGSSANEPHDAEPLMRALVSILLRLLFKAAVVGDVGVSLVFVGVRGLWGSEGPEGFIFLLAVAAGCLAACCGVCGALLSRDERRPALWRRLAAMALVALPWMGGALWMRPDPWSFPKKPEVRCFSPALRDKLGEIGWTVDGERVVLHWLFPSRTTDFVYLVRVGNSLTQYPMDCSDSRRCRSASGTDDELRAALAPLPTCE
jgi:hypothetical protein